MMQVGATLWAGDPPAACLLLQRFSEGQPPEHPASFTPTYRLGLLAFMQAVQGRHLDGAHEMAKQALAGEVPRGRLRSTESQFAWLALGLTSLARADISAARSSLEEVRQATLVNPNPNIAATVEITLARVELAVGDIPAARRNLAAARQLLSQYPGMLLVTTLAAAAQVEVELACGSVNAAREVLTRQTTGVGSALDVLVLSNARVLLAEGAYEKAMYVVAPLLEAPGVSGVGAWLVVSRAEERLRHDALSIEACARAIDIAADPGLLHPFLQPLSWLASDLRRHARIVATHQDFVTRALALATTPWDQGLAEHVHTNAATLTERELSVLLHLPTMSSNTEIAAALNISMNTVKQHLKSSYRKLGVGTRRDAVRVARDRGLLHH